MFLTFTIKHHQHHIESYYIRCETYQHAERLADKLAASVKVFNIDVSSELTILEMSQRTQTAIILILFWLSKQPPQTIRSTNNAQENTKFQSR